MGGFSDDDPAAVSKRSQESIGAKYVRERSAEKPKAENVEKPAAKDPPVKLI